MKTLEYRTIDKSAWRDGPWHHEPDKRQWQDPVTGLFCLVLRNQVLRNLCGYVGVPPDHPAYGLDYNGITDAEAQANKAAFRRWAAAGYPPLDKWWAKHPSAKRVDQPVPGIGERLQNIEVHGGLTYCGESHGVEPASWDQLKANVVKAASDAVIYPRGDAARFVQRWRKAAADYDAYVQGVRLHLICCEMDPDEPPTLWFFGFDCGHAGDLKPGLESALEEIGYKRLVREFLGDDVYRDLAYVEAQVTELAKQLAALCVPIKLRE